MTPPPEPRQPTEDDAFLRHMCQAAERVVEDIPATVRPEVYALSCEVWRVDQDPRWPHLVLGYNTESQVRRALRAGPARDPQEVRWHYADWILEGFPAVGHHPDDPTGSALYLAETRRRGLWYEEGELSEEEALERNRALLDHFDQVWRRVVWHLHHSGVVTRVLGRPVPVVVFDMDRPGWEGAATLAANPPALVAAFRAAMADEADD